MNGLNRFFESRGGARLSLAILASLMLLLAHAGWREWRSWPLGKPATLLFVKAEPAGDDLLVSFALAKSRECPFTSSRWVERLDSGERWYLSGADASSVDPGDDAVKRIRFALPPGLPDGAYAFRTKGLYSCPDGLYDSDPSFAPFTLGRTQASR